MEVNGVSGEASKVNHELEANSVFRYSDSSFLYEMSSNHNQEGISPFDVVLIRKWNEAKKAGVFNYSVDGVKTKLWSGKYKMVAQLSTNRFHMRRKPESFMSVVQPVDPTRFNFTKIKTDEILADVQFFKKFVEEKSKEKALLQGIIAVNVSPICSTHSLLMPFCSEIKPQVMDSQCLTLGVHVVLLSHTPNLRVGFNSMAGFASVNHQHLHLYYLPHQLFLETAECVHLAGPCYVFKDYHSPGFVFQLENQDVDKLVSSAMVIVKMCIEKEIAHNIFITRGAPLNGGLSSDSYTTVRLIIWARKPSYGMKDISKFAAAVCEFGGHIPVYSEDVWDTLGENDVAPILKEMCKEHFDYLLPKVIQEFS